MLSIISLLDHINTEFKTRFGPPQLKAAKLLTLVPSVVANGDLNIKDVAEFYDDDLPNPCTLDFEATQWERRWSSVETKPDTLETSLKACDADSFPNTHTLLRIACTIPVSSAENERCNSVLKAIKNPMKCTKTNDRLSSLALMIIHRNFPVDINKVVEDFITMHPRRLLNKTILD